ncbi:hypothetical protein D3C87_645700 [compost metagenome]
MNTEDIELKLLANLPIPFNDKLLLHIPSFKKVSEIGLSIYNQYLAILLIDKNALEKELDERITNFDIFFANCYHDESFKDVAFQALRLFFMDEPELYSNENDVAILFSSLGRIDHSNFDGLQLILKIANHLKLESEPEFKAGNSRAQEMINMILKNRKSQPKPKEKIDLVSMVSGLAWKSNGITILDIFDLNIYQIYNGFFTTNNIDNYHHTVSGLYAGTIDGKSIKMSDIHWANKLS